MKRKKTVFLAEVAILAALVILMSFTPLGFLKIGAIEITFIVIPVAVGAICIGPLAGAVLGGVFGLMSFIQCFGMSAFGTMLFGINPVFTAILCLVPRILMGFLSGLIFSAFKNKNILSFGLGSLSAALLNTIFFVLELILLFGNTQEIIDMQQSLGGGNLFAFIIAFVGINGLVEAVICTVLGTAISKAVYLVNTKKLA